MNDFKELIREALLGDEPYVPDVGREELERSVRKFEQRHKTARYLAWVGITMGSALTFFGAYSLWQADDQTSVKMLIVYGALIAFGSSQIAFMKQWVFRVQDHLSMMKEIKATQMLLADLLASRTAER